MKRLTTDHPDGNFETSMNYVFSDDGWACIRHDGNHGNVPLHEWCKHQCLAEGCDYCASDPETIDEILCDCAIWPTEEDGKFCPVAMAYTFAVQACHLRDRLKRYEDILFDTDGTELITLEQLAKLRLEG